MNQLMRFIAWMFDNNYQCGSLEGMRAVDRKQGIINAWPMINLIIWACRMESLVPSFSLLHAETSYAKSRDKKRERREYLAGQRLPDL